MALPAAYPGAIGHGLVPTLYGVTLGLVPGDALFGVELQRAPDNGSGAPNVGAAILLYTFPSLPLRGLPYIDYLPHDGAKRFYRARHVRTGYTAGDYTDWTPGVIPTAITGTDPGIGPFAAIVGADSAVALPRSAGIAGQTRSLAALVSTPELLINGEFDIWETPNAPHAWTVDTGDSSSATRTVTAGEVLSGEAALKYSFGAGGSAGTYRGVTTYDPVRASAFSLPLRAGRTYRFLVGSRVSSIAGGGESYRLTLTFNVGATLTASKTIAYAAATTYQVDEWQVSVPAAAEPYSKLAVEFTRSNTTAHDFWVDSLRVLEDAPSAAAIAAQLANSGVDFAQNGGFEQGTAYWRQTSGGSLTSTATSPIEGALSGQVTTSPSATHRFQQCDRATDLVDPSGGTALYIPVEPFDEVFGSMRWSCNVNLGVGDTVQLGIEEYDVAKGLIQRTYIGVQTSGGISSGTVRGGAVLSSTTRFVVIIGERITNAGSGGQTQKFDAVHVYRAAAKRRARAWLTANLSVVTATNTAVGMTSEDWDVGNLHDTVTNTARISIPADFPKVGVLNLHGQASFAANATGFRRVRIRKNGATFLNSSVCQVNSVNGQTDLVCVVVVQCNGLVPGTDYFELVVDQNSGGNLNVNAGADLTFIEAVHVY